MGVGSIVGANAVMGLASKGIDYLAQRSLFNQQTDYSSMMQKMRAAGITPAAAAAGIAGSPGNNMPSYSGAGAFPNVSDAVNAYAAQVNAENQGKRIAVENEFDRLKMFWQPKLWKTEISESYSRLMKNAAESKYFNSLRGYYEESKAALAELRPWNLQQAILTCNNLLATYDEINSRVKKNVQETKTSAALEGLYKAETEKTYSEKFNLDMEGFAKMWENQLRSTGINPNQPFYESLKRLAFSDPKKFKEVMDNFVATLNDVDARFKANLGRNYKRNIAIAGGLLWLQNRFLKNSNIRSNTFRNVLNGVGSIIPFAGGAASSASPIMPYDIISGQTEFQRMKNLGLIPAY